MKHVQKLLFSLLIASTLAFGAASVAAQPGEAQTGPICPMIRTQIDCEGCCADGGFNFDFVGGRCTCY